MESLRILPSEDPTNPLPPNIEEDLPYYNERMMKKQEPESIDKEVIRKWIKETYKDPYNLAVEICIPDELRLELSLKYLQLHELITGETI